MAINKIPVEELKPGMVFDRSVYIDENNILAAPMVPLKEEDIKRLIKWGIKEVETEGEIVKELRSLQVWKKRRLALILMSFMMRR